MVLVTKPKRSTPAHSKRRQGSHHKKDERYMKPYWPYIPLVLIVVVGVVFSNLWTVSARGVLGYATDVSPTGLVNSTNNQRIAAGLGSLALNAKLNQAAQSKANDMVARDYWSHNTPDGATPWTFFSAAGYSYANAGENLAYGFDTSDSTVTAWMNSPEHKANVLGSYTEVGFGIANSGNYQGTGPETIVVAMYATPAAAPDPAPTPPAPAASKPVARQPSAPAASETPAATSTTDQTATAPLKETNATAASNSGVSKANNDRNVATKNVSRIQLITNGQAAWSTFVVTALAVVAVSVFILRHGIFWHRFLVRGENFITRHKFLDIALVATAVIAYILTRSAGVIH